jgi:hypothetical protein
MCDFFWDLELVVCLMGIGYRPGLGMPRSNVRFQWLRTDMVTSLDLLNVSVHLSSETIVFGLASSSSWFNFKFA